MSGRRERSDSLDEDVDTEQRRVYRQERKAGSLVVKGLSKQYRLHNLRRLVAVNDLTFAVQPGEIFGLCGVNGAGKTSTFRMLTGQLIPSEGSAQIRGNPITSRKSRRLIGYCPQIDALDFLLTGRQLMNVYCELKGIEDSETVIENVLKSFEMTAYADKQIKSYSGGMRRKLCVALAMLGDPQVIFLDEPTAGLDPVARRTVWGQILAASNRGSAIVLTTHSMAECEALCNRISIMLNGRLACLGSSQHLKNKYGQGYTLKVKVNGPPPHLAKLINFVTNTWSNAEMKDQHLSTVEFAISNVDSLGSIFSKMEAQRDNLYIAEYSVFQTTLDQVFIQFARNQADRIDGSSDGDIESSSEGTSRYASNKNFAANPEEISLRDESAVMSGALKTLDGKNVWNTQL